MLISRTKIWVAFYLSLGFFTATAFNNCSAKKIDFENPASMEKVAGLAINEDNKSAIIIVDGEDQAEDKADSDEMIQIDDSKVDSTVIVKEEEAKVEEEVKVEAPVIVKEEEVKAEEEVKIEAPVIVKEEAPVIAKEEVQEQIVIKVDEDDAQNDIGAACADWIADQNKKFSDMRLVNADEEDELDLHDITNSGFFGIIARDHAESLDLQHRKIQGPLYVCGVAVSNLCRNSGSPLVVSDIAGSSVSLASSEACKENKDSQHSAVNQQSESSSNSKKK